MNKTGINLETKSRWVGGGGEIFRNCPDRPWGPPSCLYSGYRVYPGGKEGPRRCADPSPLLVPCSRKSTAIPLLPLLTVQPVQSLSACTVQLYLYSPYGPYGLCRTSVPVQGCTLPVPFYLKTGRSNYRVTCCVPPVAFHRTKS